jgi:AcrR family transcriptional regulator
MNTPLLTRHERRRLQTRRQLIHTTLQLVLEKGYDTITIQDITDQADLGRGTFYIHFKDKEDVVWAAIQDMILEMEQEAHSKFKRGVLPYEEFYGLLNIYQHAEKNRSLYRVVFGGQGSAVLTGRVYDLLANVVLNDIRSTPEPQENTFNIPEEIEAQMLAGMLARLLYWWLEKPNHYSARQMAEMTYQALFHQNPPPPEE